MHHRDNEPEGCEGREANIATSFVFKNAGQGQAFSEVRSQRRSETPRLRGAGGQGTTRRPAGSIVPASMTKREADAVILSCISKMRDRLRVSREVLAFMRQAFGDDEVEGISWLGPGN